VLNSIALIVVLLTSAYFIALAVASIVVPGRTAAFLLGFASSAQAHYVELLVRIFVGVAFLSHAPFMSHPRVFTLVGTVLVATSLALLMVPWRWHHRFAQAVVPHAVRYLVIVGMVSGGAGVFILLSVFNRAAA